MQHALKLDSSRFLSQECPACRRRFKIQPETQKLNDVAHCPYCGQDGAKWWTPAQAKYLEAVAARTVAEMMHDKMKSLKGWKAGPLPIIPPAPPEADDELTHRTTFECCPGTIRHDGASRRLRCVLCGTSAELT